MAPTKMQPEFITWDFKTVVENESKAIRLAIAAFDGENYQELITSLRQRIVTDKATGIAHSLLRGPDDSKHMAIMHFNPFGNALTSKMLLRAELCRRVIRASGITDSDGKALPVLTCSSPHVHSSLRLKRHHRRTIAGGSFEPAAQNYLKLAESLGFKQLDFIGFSQGGALAASTAATAVQTGWPVKKLVVGDPVNLLFRNRRELAKLFRAEYPLLRQAIASAGIKSIKTAHQEEKLLTTFLGVLRRGRTNYALLGGLAQNRFKADIDLLAEAGVVITIGHGEHSQISPHHALKPMVESLNAGKSPIELIIVSDSTHSWGEHIDLLAVFYAHGLSR